MSLPTNTSQEVIPAQLGYLAIYNPTLGSNDESLADQIVYYFSSKYPKIRTRSSGKSATQSSTRRLRTNEQLRQIGLSQGMIEFAKNFSRGQHVDTIDTKKSRIVLHELEANWWILASINLTIIPGQSAASGKALEQQGSNEYSSRNVKPAALLIVDLVRAHSTFLLHHASSMSALFEQITRTRLVNLLGRFWDVFLSTWSVFMHGNPINTIHNGIKVAACGELGMGVGEENRGSGEREVLEGFVGRVQGVLDIFVSKFGDGTTQENSGWAAGEEAGSQNSYDEQWIGSGNDPGSDDGAIFLGTGAISRKSLRDISSWIEDIYRWGPYTYGIINNPSSESRTRKTRKHVDPSRDTSTSSSSKIQGNNAIHQSENDNSQGKDPSTQDASVPMPQLTTNQSSNVLGVSKTRNTKYTPELKSSRSESDGSFNLGSYLKLGYGTHWTLGRNFSLSQSDTSSLHDPSTLNCEQNLITAESTNKNKPHPVGYFLIGLTEIIDESIEVVPKDMNQISETYADQSGGEPKLSLRNLMLELNQENPQVQTGIANSSGQTDGSETSKIKYFDDQIPESQLDNDENKSTFVKLPVVVFVHKPFIFLFLFEPNTEALKSASLYSSLQHQIQPIIKPLLVSTSYRASRPQAATLDSSDSPIYDLIWDPDALTINSTIPEIPDPSNYQLHSANSMIWSRVEALNTHMQIIKAYISSQGDSYQLERTSKTSQGWWIVWTKVFEPGLDQSQGRTLDSMNFNGSLTEVSFGASKGDQVSSNASLDSRQSLRLRYKEIILIRRASDHTGTKSASRFSSAPLASESNWTFEPSKLAQGIGIDTKRYIEGLLNLNI
ncbi:hypothetical protein K3495_g3402 [Podosphaera aphanis]|nr:hypothetical protein K3495_g3402 [Podosphaera aphanis]